MRYRYLILLLAGCVSPSPKDNTLEKLGITNVVFDYRMFDCGRDMQGGTYRGIREGVPVKGNFCCDISECFYNLK